MEEDLSSDEGGDHVAGRIVGGVIALGLMATGLLFLFFQVVPDRWFHPPELPVQPFMANIGVMLFCMVSGAAGWYLLRGR